jgi:predicted metal-dependent peptidase
MSSDPKDKHLNKMQNLACDMAINQYLPNLPEGAVYPETFGLQKEMFAEWYFAKLKEQQQQQQQQQSKGGKGGQTGTPSDDGEQGEKGDEQGQDDGMGGHDTLDDHEMWGKAIDEKGNIKDASECEACDVEHELDKIVRQAVKECEGDKSIGELPAGVRREIEALANPKKKHDWKKELKVFVNTVLTLSKRLSQKRANRRFLETVDYILPGKKKDRRPKILLARDTSGSVCNDEIQTQFLNEMINISKFCDVLVCDCDAKVHQTYTVKKVTDFKKYIGGGGTSFEPVFAEAKKLTVDGIIYLTDTEGSFPKKEEIGKFAQKTIWVTIDQDNVSVPFGKHVNIKDE